MSLRSIIKPDSAPLFVIAGPCVIESLDLCLRVGEALRDAAVRLGIPYVFKASFDKANRSSASGFRGPGLEEGLDILRKVKAELGVPTLTDVHESAQAAPAAQAVDILQIPAFLARQTDLLVACGRTGRPVNVKKGQFMAPAEMKLAVEKIGSTGCRDILITERGTFFGYNRLVNDFAGLLTLRENGCPLVFDATHSTQQPAGLGTQSGGNRAAAPLLARAAIAAGFDGLFIEAHTDPDRAKSDAAVVLNVPTAVRVIEQCLAIAELRPSWR